MHGIDAREVEKILEDLVKEKKLNGLVIQTTNIIVASRMYVATF